MAADGVGKSRSSRHQPSQLCALTWVNAYQRAMVDSSMGLQRRSDNEAAI